jgi:geranylgeranyl reductase family protein
MFRSDYGRYDLTIAGAGPCGAVLAYELARKGLKVLLLEKHKIPRDKVCAGGITVRAASVLPFDFSHLVENTIYGVRLSFKRKARVVRTYDKPLAYMVRRDKFDAFLADQACQAGARLEAGVEVRQVEVQPDNVKVATNNGSFTTPLLIAADGANSAVVRSLGWRKHFEYGLGINAQVPASSDVLSRWDRLMGLDYGIAGGYAWVFPKKDHLAVGAGGSFRVARNLRPYSLALTRSFGLGNPSGRSFQGHLMPLRRAATPLSFGRTALIGDAAGVIDPLTGEGIYYGLKSAYLALPAVLSFLEGKATGLGEYDVTLNNELGPELRIARAIQKMNSLTPRLFFHFLEDNDRFWRAFCRLLRGEKTYTALRQSLPPPLRMFFDLF